MKPQTQAYGHDHPDHWGDCDRTAVASLLDMERDDVPNWYDFPGAGGDRVPTPEQRQASHDARRDWMRSQGIEIVKVAFNAETPEGAMAAVSMRNPGVTWLMSGKSRNECGHVVLVRDGEIVWDPSPVKSGIVGPEPSSGCYWAEFLVRGHIVR